MREFQGKRRTRRILYSLPIRLVLVVFIIMLGASVWRLYEKRQIVAKERQSLLDEVAALEARRAALLAEVSNLKTARGVEAEVREKFNVVKPGERVINFVAAVATGTATTTSEATWWGRLVDWFDF